MNKNKINNSGIVFSTNPEFKIEEENEGINTLLKKEQPLKILLDKKLVR